MEACVPVVSIAKHWHTMILMTTDITSLTDIGNTGTFTNYSKQFIEMMMHLSTGGRIGSKICADVLWHYKEALYWLAARYIRDFTTIFAGWHSQICEFIHLLARDYKLEEGHMA